MWCGARRRNAWPHSCPARPARPARLQRPTLTARCPPARRGASPLPAPTVRGWAPAAVQGPSFPEPFPALARSALDRAGPAGARLTAAPWPCPLPPGPCPAGWPITGFRLERVQFAGQDVTTTYLYNVQVLDLGAPACCLLPAAFARYMLPLCICCSAHASAAALHLRMRVLLLLCQPPRPLTTPRWRAGAMRRALPLPPLTVHGAATPWRLQSRVPCSFLLPQAAIAPFDFDTS